MLLIIIIVLLILLAVWYVKIHNIMNQSLVRINEAKHDADIALTKRYSTINSMFKVAKSYAGHESNLMLNLTAARVGGTIEDTNKVLREQNKALSDVYAVAENYPDMLSSQQFLNLQSAIKDENAEYAAAKRIVNSEISVLNQMIVSFPDSLVASVNNITQVPFLEEPEDKKKDIDDIDYSIDK